jgi:hypothetical protein
VDPVGLGQELVAGSCKYGNEPAGSGATELLIIMDEKIGLYAL